jgi:hypothetical protein
MRGVRTPRKGAVRKDATGKDAMGKTHEERCDDKATANDSHVSADSPSPASPITSRRTLLTAPSRSRDIPVITNPRSRPNLRRK